MSKYLYNIVVILEKKRNQKLIVDNKKFMKMISYKRSEEQDRTGSDLASKLSSEFSLFYNLSSDGQLQKSFLHMQDIYVFDEKDITEYKNLHIELRQLYEILLTLDEGL